MPADIRAARVHRARLSGPRRVRAVTVWTAWPRTPSGSRISKARFVFGIGLEVENAAGEHLGRRVVEPEIFADHLFAAQPEEREPLFPAFVARFAIS